ncbi:class I SAM-dependent methyltransferase [Antrihabitans cavernicola]|uniref:Methyltransferase domain-containing protein n=1 Tax=Antrihabitans cavernicola TaxID=2495913 RepID=A0A5A7SHF8_9NOCA|nr:class I SAM-dependent methyltransferase [Spelaeibacter cavernicola]KAA0024592.1 methyltransferase domain-containing protein [Spelaeibacter cavernicola]
MTRDDMATSFGRETDNYNRGRPSYPQAAVDWLVPATATTIADVGAGTGKLTASMLQPDRDVIAVDPDTEMLASLAKQYPTVRTLHGTGEQIPLPDASVDAVVFGQAWHWVDPDAASREVARVLKPGGTLGLIWNIRDESVPWVHRLTEIMHGSAAEILIAEGGPTVSAPFESVEENRVEWQRQMTADDIVAMAASRSYVITAEEQDRERILAEIADLLANDPDVTGQSPIVMPYVTHSYRAIKP